MTTLKSKVSIAFMLATTVAVAGCGGSGNKNTTSAATVTQTNLVADTAGAGAATTDASLVNPWGITASPSGPFWIADNGTGDSTFYTTAGTKVGQITVPGAAGATNGPVSGTVFNGTNDFVIPGSTKSVFIFDNEDGVVSAWNGGAAATIVADRSATGAVYKGLTIASNGGSNFLYATNFNSGQIDVFNNAFTYMSSFTDSTVPSGYAPFGIANIGGNLYVTYAKQDAAKHDDVPGAGFGFVDVFTPGGTLMNRLASNGQLNAPWGIVQAPASFGNLGGAILVGNFGNGWINAYSPSNGSYLGSLSSSAGHPVAIDGLWGLMFGNGGSGGNTGTLYFTAGPDGETHGLFGALTISP